MVKKINVIFLDIDGVLNTPNTKTHPPLEPACMEVLNEIISLTDSKIVISSNWRTAFKLDELKELLVKHGLNGDVISITEEEHPEKFSDYRCRRGNEILLWLKKNKKKVNKFLVLDDNSLGLGEDKLISNFVRTNFLFGLTPSHVDTCVDILM